MASYRYRVYGLNVSSEIELPELPESDGEPDVTIQAGKQNKFPNQSFSQGAHRISPGVMLFTVREVGTFLIENGETVTAFPTPGCPDAMLRLFLLGSVFGMVLHMRGFLPLHGNAVALNEDGCVAFLGHSGKGKSTLAAMLMKQGYKLLADDICAVKMSGEVPLVMPGIPHVRLLADAMQILRIDSSHLEMRRPAEDKFLLPIGDRYVRTPLPLKKIYILEGAEKGSDFRIAPLPPLERIKGLRTQTYRLGFVKRIGLIKEHFSLCGEIARQLPINILMRPEHNHDLERFAGFVESQLHRPLHTHDALHR